MDLIKDESDVGQVVKVTYEDGVEFLNYNDVRRHADAVIRFDIENDSCIESALNSNLVNMISLVLPKRHFFASSISLILSITPF